MLGNEQPEFKECLRDGWGCIICKDTWTLKLDWSQGTKSMFPRTLISSDSEQLKDYGDGGTPSFGSSNYGAGPPLSPIDRPLD
ncbi:hypothetical protein MTR_2g083290 [Medicago truncatula]|uniref:Uncharacterized protein n=2 Tax=Medicago truncatula TaxID=3880 RepID=G7IJP1_MEDTR|nr:hypothetical protein MTR_2g083290 [Medicago truncatula]